MRKVRWDKESSRAYVLRDGVRYWAGEYTRIGEGDPVHVLNPDTHSVTVKYAGLSETWRADATSPGNAG